MSGCPTIVICYCASAMVAPSSTRKRPRQAIPCVLLPSRAPYIVIFLWLLVQETCICIPANVHRSHPCLHTLVYPEDRLQLALRGVVLLSDQCHRHILVWQSVRNSAETTHHGRITKRGNKLVCHARFAPHFKLTQFYRRIQAKRGTSKAAVATASKMARIMYQMLKNGRELSMGTFPIFHSGQVFKQRFLYEGSGASGC